MEKQPAILFFYNYSSTFIKKDIAILSTKFTVHTHDFYTANKLLTPFRLLSQKFFLLKNLWKADLFICQFAGYHSVLPALFGKIFGKPCLVIVGGTDAHFFPGIGYGNWQKGLLRKATVFTFKLCSHIAPKHRSLMSCHYTYDKNEPVEQGIYARMRGLKTPFTEIPNGYDTLLWQCTQQKKKGTFITISTGWEYPSQKQLKGIDLLLEVAPQFPECTFTILGVPDKTILGEVPANVQLLAPVKHNNLIDILSTQEFYMQLSVAEGFPNAICEAMLCECVPIGSDVFSIPEIVGNTGFILKERSAEKLKALIAEALQSNLPELGNAARKRIADNYTIESRSKLLIELCGKLIKQKAMFFFT
ncbi:MAG: glycosyltransferase family 4 protein [Chitinophagales bacterium]|nr:glycosyltransferase family 4 protein [Chitinophagales bacterium]